MAGPFLIAGAEASFSHTARSFPRPAMASGILLNFFLPKWQIQGDLPRPLADGA